jgi:hypothetical protein
MEPARGMEGNYAGMLQVFSVLEIKGKEGGGGVLEPEKSRPATQERIAAKPKEAAHLDTYSRLTRVEQGFPRPVTGLRQNSGLLFGTATKSGSLTL